jgi:hypothetical protein
VDAPPTTDTHSAPADDKLHFYLYAQDDNENQRLVPDRRFWNTNESNQLYTWRHLALTYDPTVTNGIWELFVDGESMGTQTNDRPPLITNPVSSFYLGGRPGNPKVTYGSFDCWRICSEVLTPQQFLNADTGAQAVAPEDVLAFWPLNFDGFVFDGASLTGNYHFTDDPSIYRLLPNNDQAITEIPNPESYESFRGDPLTNSQSVMFYQFSADGNTRAHLQAYDLGARLEVTNSFTVEGWFYRTANPGGFQYIFATRLGYSGPGWLLSLNHVGDGVARYNLFVGATAGGSYLHDIKFPLSTDESGNLNMWQHIALVYDAELDNGTWELFVDGASRGTLENTRSVEQLSNSQNLLIGGRTTSNNSFRGAIDCMRVSLGALTPAEFLNATGNPPPEPAAAQTAAHWKLESDGTTIDASSQVEPRYSLFASEPTPQPSTDRFRSSILNPDSSEEFIGDPALNIGSIGFVNENGTNRYLTVQNLGNRMELHNPFTVEGWLKRADTSGEAVQVIAGTRFDTECGWLLTLEDSGENAVLRLTVKDQHLEPLLDTTFDCTGALENTEWHHLALVYRPWEEDCGTWQLYVDGALKGSTRFARYPEYPHSSHRFLLGGRPEETSSFNGLLDCWRITEGALEPDDFMYVEFQRSTLMIIR